MSDSRSVAQRLEDHPDVVCTAEVCKMGEAISCADDGAWVIALEEERAACPVNGAEACARRRASASHLHNAFEFVLLEIGVRQ